MSETREQRVKMPNGKTKVIKVKSIGAEALAKAEQRKAEKQAKTQPPANS